MAKPTRIGYLTTCYFARSHTFIRREIAALRGLALPMSFFGVRAQEGDEAELLRFSFPEEVTYVYPLSPPAILLAHTQTLFTAPIRYLGTLFMAFSSAELRPLPYLKVLYHFVVAVPLAIRMRERGVDHIHAHFTNVAATLAMHCASLNGISFSLTLHSAGETRLTSVHALKRKLREARFLVAVTTYTLNDFQQYFPIETKTHVIHCGIDDQDFESDVDHTGLADPEGLRLLAVGRLEEKKGFASLLRACAHLNVPRFNLKILGDGRLKAELQSLVQDLELGQRVQMPGAVDESAVRTAMEACDIVVVPSVRAEDGAMEGLPVVLMEAVSMGVPVVATRHAGIPELIIDGQTGLLVPESDEKALARAIERLAGDRDLRHACIEGGRKLLRESFNIKDSAMRLHRLFSTECPGADQEKRLPRDRIEPTTR